jgi:hypothetical protein
MFKHIGMDPGMRLALIVASDVTVFPVLSFLHSFPLGPIMVIHLAPVGSSTAPTPSSQLPASLTKMPSIWSGLSLATMVYSLRSCSPVSLTRRKRDS